MPTATKRKQRAPQSADDSALPDLIREKRELVGLRRQMTEENIPVGDYLRARQAYFAEKERALREGTLRSEVLGVKVPPAVAKRMRRIPTRGAPLTGQPVLQT